MDFLKQQCYTLIKYRKKCERRTNMIPKDPVMLLSFINLKLRDYYKDLEACCDNLDISQSELTEKLAAIGYKYDEQRNQFV